jgi:hypothetical protein
MPSSIVMRPGLAVVTCASAVASTFATYVAGSASNARLQPDRQKAYVRPSCSKINPASSARATFTVMPHTGSSTVSGRDPLKLMSPF